MLRPQDTAVLRSTVTTTNGGIVLKKKWSLLAGIAAAALLVTGRSSGSSAPAEEPESGGESSELTPVTIGVVPVVDFAPVYIAQREGLFEMYGLDVTIEVVQNFAAAVPSLMNGQLQFTGAALPPFIAAVDIPTTNATSLLCATSLIATTRSRL